MCPEKWTPLSSVCIHPSLDAMRYILRIAIAMPYLWKLFKILKYNDYCLSIRWSITTYTRTVAVHKRCAMHENELPQGREAK
jgi:hypothetical protein